MIRIIMLPLLADIDALKDANEELNAVNNRLRISWREDTARIAIERDQWKKAYLDMCSALDPKP